MKIRMKSCPLFSSNKQMPNQPRVQWAHDDLPQYSNIAEFGSGASTQCVSKDLMPQKMGLQVV